MRDYPTMEHYNWTQIQVKEQHLYCSSSFHSHSRVQQWAKLIPWNECVTAPSMIHVY